MNKKLYRNIFDKMLAGVCSGLGEFLDIDATVIRLLFVLVTIFTAFFPGIIAYIIMAAIIPVKPEMPPQA